MSFLDKLERSLGRYAIPHLALYIVIGQAVVLLAAMLQLIDLGYFYLVPSLVVHGQWWRLITFIFYLAPPTGTFGPIFVAFALYMFYMMSASLEGYWSAFRYNLFLFIGYLLTVGAAFLTPGSPVTNLFLGASVFLAFAYLNPDFEFLLFFILPVKVKWLALFAWLGYGVSFFLGGWPARLQILAAVGNFLVFFSADMVRSLRHGRRVAVRRARDVVETDEPRHRCHVCGKTDLTNPELDFRYCSKCDGDQCYCPEHIQNHAHVVAPDEPAQA